MFEALLSAVKLAGSSLQWMLQLNNEKRKNLAALFDRISANLESFAKSRDDQGQSRNLCMELRVYVPEIKNIAQGMLESTQLESMAFELENACAAWAAHSASVGQDSERGGDDLFEIQSAAGHFRGLAALVRAM